jgi:glycosyltransferase involved in cell wall biosynthesis
LNGWHPDVRRRRDAILWKRRPCSRGPTTVRGTNQPTDPAPGCSFMIIFVDSKTGRGGGQVVLEQLLHDALSIDSVGLAMPNRGRRAISCPDQVLQADSIEQLASGHEPLLLVANANSSFPHTLAAGWRLRRRGHIVGTVAIVHNYPSTRLKGAATVSSLARFDHSIAVEPGLAALRRDICIPSWLSLRPDFPIMPRSNIERSGNVKCFARPDRTKGLHMLAQIFPELEAAGLRCAVALGTPLDGNEGYERQLRDSLAPWLEPGPRTPAWIEPGDIFLVPSLSGEAACLSAQEAMARGAWVVASRLGLMPYLSPTCEGIVTFRAGDSTAAVDAILATQRMNPARFAEGCTAAQREMIRRQGRWYEDVQARLVRFRRELTA